MSHYLISEQREWLLEHGERRDDKWFCKKTGVPINGKSFQYNECSFSAGGPQFERAVHPQDEGGRSYQVIALWCTRCGTEPKEKPSINIPREIVEVEGGGLS